MRHSLRNLLLTIFSGFLLIIITSLIFNLVTLRAHSIHKGVLAHAYDLRMLTQKMLIQISVAKSNVLDLSPSIPEFERHLNALKTYGESHDKPFGDHFIYPQIVHNNYGPELSIIFATWAEFIADRNELLKFTPSNPNYEADKQEMLAVLESLFTQADSFSNELDELDNEQDANQLKVQFLFLGFGVSLLAWGLYVIAFRIIRPLSYLDTAVREIGQGKNNESIQVNTDDELGRLARTFDQMRTEISAAQKLLEDRVRERTGVLTDAFEFSQEIVSQPDFGNLVDSITQRAKNLMHAKYVNLCLVTSDMKRLELKSKRDKNFFVSAGEPPFYGQLSEDAMVDVESTDVQVDAICKKHQQQIAGECLSVPLHNGGFNIGALCVVRDQNLPFTDIEKHTLTLLANSAAVAIANIRLLEDSRKQTELNATLNERQRLTSELHDEAAQTLGLLNLKVSVLDDQLSEREPEIAAELKQFKQLAERAQAQMRMAFSGMNSAIIQKNNDLHKELEDYAKEFSNTSGLPVDLVIGDAAALTIPALIQKQIMYIYREALTNIRRYANAKKVQVQLEYQKEGLQIMVGDDGRGFDLNLSKGDHHLGLSVMQARAERVGGTLSIETAPGAGTKVIARIPILRTETIVREMVK